MKKNVSTCILMLFLISAGLHTEARVYSCDSNWTLRQSGTTENLKKIDWDGNRFTVFANSETALLSSEDGIHWSRQSTLTNMYKPSHTLAADIKSMFLSGAVLANDTWVTFIDTRIYSSKDKNIWKLEDAFLEVENDYPEESRGFGFPSIRIEMRWVKFIGNKAYTSLDGHQWHKQDRLSRPHWWRIGIAVLRVVKNKFVAINFLGSTYVSENGKQWLRGGLASRPGSVATDGENLILVGWYGGVKISKDAGMSWVDVQSQILDEEGSQRQYIGDVVINRNKKIIISQGLEGILYSDDGFSWEKDTLNIHMPMQTSFGVVDTGNTAWNGDTLVSIGNSGAIYTAACHPDEQTNSPDSKHSLPDTFFRSDGNESQTR